ncbi:hypothetical protein [Paenibacillus sp. PL2-23]|uniref:hypothetical protein n=1 Tax=Paenibacillus sp. PL2-23 TaxID=2100729 RepID=UPI0030F9DEA1
MEQIVNEINTKVLQARKEAVAWQTFAAESTNKYLMQWYTSANAFVQNPAAEPKLLHARFGYAIETLACTRLPSSYNGLKIDLQVSSGHTRPDIVISDGVMELAWIDITSEKSEEHILGKDGSGWRRRPFVYEVLYDQLDLQELLVATNDSFYNEYGSYVAKEHQIEHDIQVDIKKAKRDEFIKLRDTNGWESGIGNAKNKQEATKNFLFGITGSEDIYEEDYKNKLQQTKGALHYFGLNAGPFGFRQEAEDGTAARDYVRKEAAPRVEEQKGILAMSKNIELSRFFEPYYSKLKVVQTFCDLADAFTPDRELVKTGMALKAAIMDYEGMDRLFLYTETMLADEERVRKLQAHAKGLLSQFPAVLDFDKIIEWRNLVKQCYQTAELLRRTQSVQHAFIQYVKQKYTYPNTPGQVHAILIELAKDTPNAQFIDAAQNWMLANP